MTQYDQNMKATNQQQYHQTQHEGNTTSQNIDQLRQANSPSQPGQPFVFTGNQVLSSQSVNRSPRDSNFSTTSMIQSTTLMPEEAQKEYM